MKLTTCGRPRAGDIVYGFAAGLYPTDHPTLPDAENAIVDEVPVLLPLATEVGAAALRARI